MTTQQHVGHRPTVCVDLDGTLADYSQGWQGVDTIGDPLPGAQAFVAQLRRSYEVVIFTTRCNPEVNKPEAVHLLRNRVAAWLDRHGFEYDDIYTGTGKPIAGAYIDDRAIRCNPARYERPQDAYRMALTATWALLGGPEPEDLTTSVDATGKGAPRGPAGRTIPSGSGPGPTRTRRAK
jgi:hypothetical protein